MKIITVWNMKGGVGKTTLTFNLAANFGHQGKQVLCIDFDPQANLTSFFEKDPSKKRKKYDICELAARAFADLDRSIYKSKYKGMDYVKGSNRQAAAPGIFDLAAALGKMGQAYDYCLIDCHPDFSDMTQAALLSADLVVVPILLDAFSRDNLNLVRSCIEKTEGVLEDYPGKQDPDLSYCVVANRVANRRSQKDVYKDIITRHDYPILDICIGEGAAVQSANRAHKPLYAHRSSSPANNDIKEVTKHIGGILDREAGHHG